MPAGYQHDLLRTGTPGVFGAFRLYHESVPGLLCTQGGDRGRVGRNDRRDRRGKGRSSPGRQPGQGDAGRQPDRHGEPCQGSKRPDHDPRPICLGAVRPEHPVGLRDPHRCRDGEQGPGGGYESGAVGHAHGRVSGRRQQRRAAHFRRQGPGPVLWDGRYRKALCRWRSLYL